MKIQSFHNNGYCRIRARPLTLKEVLRLRDGMEVVRNQPYQIQKISNNEKLLLSLN
jgi:hypothetical protein